MEHSQYVQLNEEKWRKLNKKMNMRIIPFIFFRTKKRMGTNLFDSAIKMKCGCK